MRLARIEIIQKFNESVAGVCFVHKFFTENVWELVTVPSESLPTRQNGVENLDEAYYVLTVIRAIYVFNIAMATAY